LPRSTASGRPASSTPRYGPLIPGVSNAPSVSPRLKRAHARKQPRSRRFCLEKSTAAGRIPAIISLPITARTIGAVLFSRHPRQACRALSCSLHAPSSRTFSAGAKGIDNARTAFTAWLYAVPDRASPGPDRRDRGCQPAFGGRIGLVVRPRAGPYVIAAAAACASGTTSWS
jgi:hypothetical protein